MSEGQLRAAGLPTRRCVGVGEHLPLAESCIDGAVSMTPLEWVEDPLRCASEARRVLRPREQLAIGFLSALSPWSAFYRWQADERVEPSRGTRFLTRTDIENLIGASPDSVQRIVHLAPQARRPWETAEMAGRRAGNQPALEVLRWNPTK